MFLLFVKAYWNLIRFELLLARNDFAALHARVRDCPVGLRKGEPAPARICNAVDYACIWYWKRVLCLHRSATTAWLLKQNGFEAEMVIGAQLTPFRSHAWVELAGTVLNDKPYVGNIYQVLDRC
jgi:hypothetical protein